MGVYRTGHVGASLAFNAPLGFLVVAVDATPLLPAVGVVAVWGATLPDYDLRIPFLTHRGITHTVYFVALCGAVAGGIAAYAGSVGTGPPGPVVLGAAGAALGTLTVGSHLAADMLTPAGVDLFYTGTDRSLYVTTADSTVANYALLALGVLVAAGALAAGAAVRDGITLPV